MTDPLATFAINCVIREDQAPRIGGTAEQVVDDYATDLADQLDGNRDRLYAACVTAAEEVTRPGGGAQH